MFTVVKIALLQINPTVGDLQGNSRLIVEATREAGRLGADLEYSPEEFPELIELICQGRADVVYGSRFLGRHRVFLFTHYLGNRLLNIVTNVLYNTMLTDMETCYKVMTVEVLRSITLHSNGFGIEPEITAKVFKRGYRVYEIPITYDGRGYKEGKKITWRDGFVALWVLLKYRFTE